MRWRMRRVYVVSDGFVVCCLLSVVRSLLDDCMHMPIEKRNPFHFIPSFLSSPFMTCLQFTYRSSFCFACSPCLCFFFSECIFSRLSSVPVHISDSSIGSIPPSCLFSAFLVHMYLSCSSSYVVYYCHAYAYDDDDVSLFTSIYPHIAFKLDPHDTTQKRISQ